MKFFHALETKFPARRVQVIQTEEEFKDKIELKMNYFGIKDDKLTELMAKHSAKLGFECLDVTDKILAAVEFVPMPIKQEEDFNKVIDKQKSILEPDSE